MVGTIGPIGSGLPQLGLPRRFAMFALFRFVQDVFRMTEVAPAMPYGPDTLTNWIHAASLTIQGALWGLSQQTAGTGRSCNGAEELLTIARFRAKFNLLALLGCRPTTKLAGS